MNECCAAAPASPRSDEPLPRAARRAAHASLLLSTVLAVLVPKCPMCLGAYLSLLGAGGLAAVAHPVLRALSIVLVVFAAAILLREQAVRRRASSAGA